MTTPRSGLYDGRIHIRWRSYEVSIMTVNLYEPARALVDLLLKVLEWLAL